MTADSTPTYYYRPYNDEWVLTHDSCWWTTLKFCPLNVTRSRLRESLLELCGPSTNWPKTITSLWFYSLRLEQELRSEVGIPSTDGGTEIPVETYSPLQSRDIDLWLEMGSGLLLLWVKRHVRSCLGLGPVNG